LESEGSENTTAYYTHDTVTGPLSGAKAKEDFSEDQDRGDEKIHKPLASELMRKMQPTESELDVSMCFFTHHRDLNILCVKVKADRGEI